MFLLNRKSVDLLYFSYGRPLLEYADIIWDNIPLDLFRKLENINIEATPIVTGATKLSSNEKLLKRLDGINCEQGEWNQNYNKRVILIWKGTLMSLNWLKRSGNDEDDEGGEGLYPFLEYHFSFKW